jgi:hypothetical protein
MEISSRRSRHSPLDVPPMVEAAARVLTKMQSLACAWEFVPSEDDYDTADFFGEDGTADLEAVPEHHGILRVFRRGTKMMSKTGTLDGVKGLRFFNASSAGIVPKVSGAERAATALAFAKLQRIPEALLLTYAGDFSQWPAVRSVACALRPGASWAAAVEDAGHRLMFARAVKPAADRARELRERKSVLLALRREAETLLKGWLESASVRFLRTLDGFGGTVMPARST